MDLEQKLAISADAAKYDVSCASSGAGAGEGRELETRRRHLPQLDGGRALRKPAGSCCTPTSAAMTAYCEPAQQRACPGQLHPDELARLTIDFYRRNMIEGLFLSSAVAVSPDRTMERLIRWRRSCGTGAV